MTNKPIEMMLEESPFAQYAIRAAGSGVRVPGPGYSIAHKAPWGTESVLESALRAFDASSLRLSQPLGLPSLNLR